MSGRQEQLYNKWIDTTAFKREFPDKTVRIENCIKQIHKTINKATAFDKPTERNVNVLKAAISKYDLDSNFICDILDASQEYKDAV
jgi:hypothetical protein